MAKRKKVPTEVETEVLTRSRRRCCICFGLHQDLVIRKGQVAHLDGDPSNGRFDNLAWLCHDHHDEYDSTTRQSKGLTMREVKKYRDSLYEAVSEMVKASLPVEPTAALQDVPLLSVSRPIGPKQGIPVEEFKRYLEGEAEKDDAWA